MKAHYVMHVHLFWKHNVIIFILCGRRLCLVYFLMRFLVAKRVEREDMGDEGAPGAGSALGEAMHHPS